MTDFIKNLPGCGKSLPILSFPSVAITGKSVYELTHSAVAQAEGILAVQSRWNTAAAVTVMDLSVEAEAFGAEIAAPEDEVPNVIGALVEDEDGVEELAVPSVTDSRTGIYVEAVKLVKEKLSDRPLYAGIIGPFSLAGRLMDVTEALVNCIADPDFVHATLKKVTPFLIEYARAFKEAGADGIVMAEPLAGLLSPTQEKEFSNPYVKEIIQAVGDDSFAVIYHNCGPNTPLMTESFKDIGADAYHFGDSIDLIDVLGKMEGEIVMGNISPSGFFVGGTPETMREAVLDLRRKAKKYNNFVLSSGCDIPPQASLSNIDAFFKAGEEII